MQRVVGTDLSGLDFPALAKGHGLPQGRRVAEAGSLEAILAEALASPGPSLVEVLVA